MRMAERQRQRRAVFRDQDQVHVIGHQTPAQHLDIVAGRLLTEELQVELTVLSGTEDSLAIVAALGDVVRRTGNDNPWIGEAYRG